MADEIVYRLVQGEGIQIKEDAATKTVEVSVPGLTSKLDKTEIGQASEVQFGIVKLATTAQVRAGTDIENAVTPAGLAAASQSTAYDATSGRLLKVGAFGLGDSLPNTFDQDLNADRPTGFYFVTGNTQNSPYGLLGWLLHQRFPGNGHTYQRFVPVDTSREFVRVKYNNVWQPWRELFSTGNFDPASKANTSGNYPGITAGDSAQLGGQTAEMLAFPGMITYSAIPSTPTDGGWLYCNGAAVSRTTYARLFARMGTYWGAGNGSSTFNLPDLRGVFLRSVDDGRGIDSGRGWGSFQSSQNLQHSHSAATDSQGGHDHAASVSSVGDHQHTIYGQDNDGRATGAAVNELANIENPGSTWAIWQRVTSAAGGHSHSVSVNVNGVHSHNVSVTQNGGNESRPPNIALYPFIKY